MIWRSDRLVQNGDFACGRHLNAADFPPDAFGGLQHRCQPPFYFGCSKMSWDGWLCHSLLQYTSFFRSTPRPDQVSAIRPVEKRGLDWRGEARIIEHAALIVLWLVAVGAR